MNHMTIVSLGAGVQSTAMLLMAENGDFGTIPDAAIFADTQWEPQGVYDQLSKIKETCTTTIHVVSSGNLREEFIERMRGNRATGRSANPPFFVKKPDGSVGQLHPRTCTKEYKLTPLRRKARELLGPRGKVTMWIGISIDEAHRMRDSGLLWCENRYPLIDHSITRKQCEDYLKDHNFKPAKSACIGCPYHSERNWKLKKRTDPKSWEDAVAVDREMRAFTLPDGSKVFMSRKCMPLDEAVKLSEEQFDLFEDNFGEECEGMCGV
jgi:hypothetical protein